MRLHPKVVETTYQQKFLHMGVPPLKKREGYRGNLGESRLNLPENGLRSFKEWLCGWTRAKSWAFWLLSRNGAGLSELLTWNSGARVSMMPTVHVPDSTVSAPL